MLHSDWTAISVAARTKDECIVIDAKIGQRRTIANKTIEDFDEMNATFLKALCSLSRRAIQTNNKHKHACEAIKGIYTFPKGVSLIFDAWGITTSYRRRPGIFNLLL